MAVLTTIAGVPLFTTTQEALTWAAGNNCSGYHTHNYQGQQGFMGCTNHLQASGMPLNSNAPPPQTQANTQVNIPTTGSSVYSGGGGGSTGGGGGSTGGGGGGY